MQNSNTNFLATVSIVNLSLTAKMMIANLPDPYTRDENSGVFSIAYGSGYQMDQTKQTVKQLEVNNVLYSPETETHYYKVAGPGKYYIPFDVPFIFPPINVSITNASLSDVFIEYTDRYGMLVNVQTYIQDYIEWAVYGFVGAASDEVLGDALYDNFGVLYGLPRLGDAQINNAFVLPYENNNVFLTVQNIIPVNTITQSGTSFVITQNAPPINTQYLTGVIQPTNVLTSPEGNNELRDTNGNLLAMLDTAATTVPASAYYIGANFNYEKPDPRVYVIGSQSTYTFDAWSQPSYVQEVFRADYVYRRMLTGINKALNAGPTKNGIALLVESLFAQPYISEEFWEENDYRIFENTIGFNRPKYMTLTIPPTGGISAISAASQYDGYPTLPPTVQINKVLQSWDPETITYNNQPETVPLDTPVAVQVTLLNSATRFDISSEITRQLRLGLNTPTGGVINWNYANTSTIPTTGYNLYQTYNYFFLNNPGDSYSNLTLFYYAQKTNSYFCYGPLQPLQGYYIIPTSTFYAAASGAYELPSELLQGYAVNSTIPFQGTNTLWTGAGSASLPNLPSFVIQLNLENQIPQIGTKFPVNINDYLVYSYGNFTLTSATINGNLATDPLSGALPCFYSSDNPNALQPSDSPFVSGGNFNTTSYAQSDFAKLITDIGYEHIISCIGGQITYNKTILVSSLFSPTSINAESISTPGIIEMQGVTTSPFVSGGTPIYNSLYPSQFQLSGKIEPMIVNGMPYVPFGSGNFVMVDVNNNVIAILDYDTFFDAAFLVGTWQTVIGNVTNVYWDTRMPTSTYRSGAPVFQTSNNFAGDAIPITPDTSFTTYKNSDFFVQIAGFPLGNQETITASWTFNLLPLPFGGTTGLYFADILNNNSVELGINSLFTGRSTGTYLGSAYFDYDGASYEQEYVSSGFSAYFLGYNDYINCFGTQISPQGESGLVNTLTRPPNNNANGSVTGTVFDFFSPLYGFISITIAPGALVYNAQGQQITIERPNNLGISLQIQGNSYAGLVFYGANGNKIVDKPTRLSMNYQYELTDTNKRTKIVDIEDNNFGNWVNATQPNDVMDNSVFYISGNQFKYPHMGMDQVENQFSSNAAGQLNTFTEPIYTTNSNPPVFEVDAALQSVPLVNLIGNEPPSEVPNPPGPPFRYRRPPTPEDSTYQTNTPQKIAYLKFDLSAFTFDTVVNQAVLEIYFCSGFTIRDGVSKNFILNKNEMWRHSRLSGNGLTYFKQLTTTNPITSVILPINNQHWRKNFFEILLPYAFISPEPQGLQSIFAPPNPLGLLPTISSSQSNLEYLGFLNLDEIDVSQLTDGGTNEVSVGLTNIVLNDNAVIYQIDGVLSFVQEGGTLIPNSPSLVNPAAIISQVNILPNMKVLIYPFGLNSTILYYGYVKSILPSGYIGFNTIDLGIYEQIFNYVIPLYSQYSVSLLESDTYFAYSTFGRDTSLQNTQSDIAY